VLGRAPRLLCRQLLPPVAAMLLLAGCGGDDGHGGTSARSAATADSRPKAKEALSVTAKRLERALPRRNCKVLIRLMLHSIQRRSTPDAPPTSGECAYIRYKAANELRGFHLTKAREFGPAGFSEGTGVNAPRGGVVGVLWLLDSDRSWKAAYQAIFRPQIDVAPSLAPRADANARRTVEALKTGDCTELWRVLNPASRFVRQVNGQREKFCRTLPATYRDTSSAFAQIKANRAPALETLGRIHDFYFYALRLKNGRYMDMVLCGQLASVPRSELKQHDNPTVLELATVRQPR
jgi:hypothetical protein